MRCIALINLIVYLQFIPNILIREERTKVVSIELSSGYTDAAQNFNYTFFFPRCTSRQLISLPIWFL